MTTALLLFDVQASFPARGYWDDALAVPWRERLWQRFERGSPQAWRLSHRRTEESNGASEQRSAPGWS